jgi:hypothetical protein
MVLEKPNQPPPIIPNNTNSTKSIVPPPIGFNVEELFSDSLQINESSLQGNTKSLTSNIYISSDHSGKILNTENNYSPNNLTSSTSSTISTSSSSSSSQEILNNSPNNNFAKQSHIKPIVPRKPGLTIANNKYNSKLMDDSLLDQVDEMESNKNPPKSPSEITSL